MTSTYSQDLARRLVTTVPALGPLMRTHLDDMDGELLPYLLLADVARWCAEEVTTSPDVVGEVVIWLEQQYAVAAPPERDLIALGFVEASPFPPEGEALLRRLGPKLAAVARELGILRER